MKLSKKSLLPQKYTEEFVYFCCRTPQGVRGLKYFDVGGCRLWLVAPRVVEKSRKSNEKSNDKVPDKVQFSMREPVEETRDLIALYAESSQAQHMYMALAENILSVSWPACKK